MKKKQKKKVYLESKSKLNFMSISYLVFYIKRFYTFMQNYMGSIFTVICPLTSPTGAILVAPTCGTTSIIVMSSP